MSILRGVILCLEREQLPIFKDTIDLALKQYFAKQKTYSIKPKNLLLRDEIPLKESGEDQSMQDEDQQESRSLPMSAIVCEQAKKQIESEI